jgi:predicted dehydrogenase
VSASAQKVMIVGVGAAGTVHAKALEGFPDAAVIAGVDIDQSRILTFRGQRVPVYPTVFDTTNRGLDPDIVVIATSTQSHRQVCSEVTEHYPQAAVIVEKPAADNLADARKMIDYGGKQPVNVTYHMAFSPEVDWALGQVSAKAELLDSPVAIESWFTDPYQAGLAAAQERFGTSWIDSGINALSVIERFARLVERTSLRQIGDTSKSTFEGSFICQLQENRLPAIVLTSWYSTAPTRTTRIRYSSGAELVMDHNAVAGYLLANGEAADMYGSDGIVPRREAHYKAWYQSWLVDKRQIFSRDTSLRLHELLLGS